MRPSFLLIAPVAVPTALVLGTGLTLVVARSLGLFSVLAPRRVSFDARRAP